jgi:ABC-type oligopeptide transport system ATPase subunit
VKCVSYRAKQKHLLVDLKEKLKTLLVFVQHQLEIRSLFIRTEGILQVTIYAHCKKVNIVWEDTF